MQEQETIICPFCHTEVSMGVAVCKGCQAEVKYNQLTTGDFIMGIVGFFIALVFVALGDIAGGHWFIGLAIGAVVAYFIVQFIKKALKINSTSVPKFYRQMKH